MKSRYCFKVFGMESQTSRVLNDIFSRVLKAPFYQGRVRALKNKFRAWTQKKDFNSYSHFIDEEVSSFGKVKEVQAEILYSLHSLSFIGESMEEFFDRCIEHFNTVKTILNYARSGEWFEEEDFQTIEEASNDTIRELSAIQRNLEREWASSSDEVPSKMSIPRNFQKEWMLYFQFIKGFMFR